MKRIIIASASVLALLGSAAPVSADPGVCDQFLEPAMERYQIFTDDVQDRIDSVTPCEE
jgi:hypothetical protein